MSEAIRPDIDGLLRTPTAALPESWKAVRADFLPKSNSVETEALRPVAPSAPLQAWAMWAMLTQHRDAPEPKWLCARGFVRGGRADADAHIMTAQLIADRSAEWGEQAWFLKVDLAGASKPCANQIYGRL